jgi:hypothetical protein
MRAVEDALFASLSFTRAQRSLPLALALAPRPLVASTSAYIPSP